MTRRVNQMRRLAVVLAALCATYYALASVRGAAADDDHKQLEQIRHEWFQLVLKDAEARRAAKTPRELEQVRAKFESQEQSLVDDCQALIAEHPDDWLGMAALKLVACHSPASDQGKQSLASLKSQVESANLDDVSKGLYYTTHTSSRPIHELGRIVLERVRKAPEHSQAPRLLASVVCAIAVDSHRGSNAPAEFSEAADLILERYADSEDIVNFCEHLGRGVVGSPPWAAQFEKHLRLILEKNQYRAVQVVALFALASVVQGTTEVRQAEAEALYEEFVTKYDGSKEYYFVEIEKALNENARTALRELHMRGLGKPAPDIVGIDLDGREMKLSSYRGKVVLLSFWATWCGPCMRMIPHEREMVKRLEGMPFDIVGVNADVDLPAAQDAVAKHGVTWRSFRDESQPNGASISEEWVVGFPTFYLIDQRGIIRKRWIGDQPPEAMNALIDNLLESSANDETVD
jgi:thiol-disulfide isomerase/thioredoxin